MSAIHSLPSDFEPGIEAMIGVVALAGVALYLRVAQGPSIRTCSVAGR